MLLREIPKREIFAVDSVPILSAMIGAIAVNMGLINRIGYVKDNNPNYHRLP